MSNNKKYTNLYKALIKLDNENICDLFLEDLCTYKELDAMEQRLVAANMLLEGKTFNEVIEATKISSATLSRISRCIKYGNGGYKKILKDR